LQKKYTINYLLYMNAQLELFKPTFTQTMIHGDCLAEMKKMDDNSIDFIVTDPPFGISFMSKHWDHQIPSHKYWKEMLRVCKPGSMMACAGLPRMIHRLGCIIEDSGWIIRDMIMHLFGQGFPKSHNHFGFEGYGTALKPSWEGWLLCMKPLDGTYKENAEKWGLAGINIKSCRIGTDGATKRSEQTQYPKNENGTEDRSQHWARTGHKIENLEIGRWPANLILDEESAEMLDQQSGISKSPLVGNRKGKRHNIDGWGHTSQEENFPCYGDSGGASRFFYCAKASSSERNKGLEGLPIKETHRYGSGIGEGKHPELPSKGQNTHPTVKPISLMKYIIKLLAPPGNPTLLDPFAGSGTTILSAKELGINAIGIEKEQEYYEIAKARIENG
jgi:site-specific DNA-methyltransferase (adenine-specific)